MKNIFEQGTMLPHFSLDPVNYGASPQWDLIGSGK